jgi:hypothetical protein
LNFNRARCGSSIKDISCGHDCGVILEDCGHSCKLYFIYNILKESLEEKFKCYLKNLFVGKNKCFQCQKKSIEKNSNVPILDEQGHVKRTDHLKCIQKCGRILYCGHPCSVKVCIKHYNQY